VNGAAGATFGAAVHAATEAPAGVAFFAAAALVTGRGPRCIRRMVWSDFGGTAGDERRGMTMKRLGRFGSFMVVVVMGCCDGCRLHTQQEASTKSMLREAERPGAHTLAVQ